MIRSINDAGLATIKQFEGRELAAYKDQKGIWTIGYGHTRGVQPGMTITDDECDMLLDCDLMSTEYAVWHALDTANVNTGNNQFSAMAALAFNIGPVAFGSSTLLKMHKAGDFEGAAQQFLLWDKIRIGEDLVPNDGLLRRRQAESGLYRKDAVLIMAKAAAA